MCLESFGINCHNLTSNSTQSSPWTPFNVLNPWILSLPQVIYYPSSIISSLSSFVSLSSFGHHCSFLFSPCFLLLLLFFFYVHCHIISFAGFEITVTSLLEEMSLVSEFKIKEANGELLPEPLLVEDKSRFVLFPIQHTDVSTSLFMKDLYCLVASC